MTLKKYRMTFTYETTGQVVAQLNSDVYDTPEKVETRLRALAAEDYHIFPADPYNTTVKEID